MSLKNYFAIAEQVNSVSGLTGQQIGGEVESVGYHEQDIKFEQRLIPRVDFSKPENFARYGLASEYYDGALKRIYGAFPYDGSRKERLEWENESLDIDLYIYENLYPRTNGYIIFSAEGWGTGNMADGYGSSSTNEYIHFYGGPHANETGFTPYATKFTGSNYYEPAKNRESNLKYDIADNGVSVEFWLKKKSFLTSLTRKEVIFDLWNGQPSSSADYGRLRIQLTGATSGLSPFRVTLLSGSTGIYDTSVGAATFTSASVADDKWHHYGFTFKSASAGLQTRFYVDGELNNEVITGSGFQEVTGALQAYIGALIAAPSASTALAGYGKMSASLDEFRYWKTQRSSKGIGRYWFTQVGGGTNTDPEPFIESIGDVNTLLGVYFKFNEGITGVTATAQTVLDYSGRITNGSWTGYTKSSRNTGSAIVISAAAIKEYKDPIIYSFHPAVVALSSSLEISGSDYDASNAANIYNSIPQWIREEDEEGQNNTRYLTQIMASYFDDFQLKARALTDLKTVEYPSGSQKPLPFAARLLNSHGFVAPDIFLDADILEKLADRSEFRVYEKTLNDIKNTIYQNIYNNLSYIYKTKGTEKSFRNLIRCFGIDDELVKINLYASDVESEMRSNRRNVAVPDKFVNFNTEQNLPGTVIQFQNPADTTNTAGYISGSGNLRNGYAFTLEAEVVFPQKISAASLGYQDTNIISASLFGVHGNAGVDEASPRWPSYAGNEDVVNFQVYAVRDEIESDNVRFMLTGTSGLTTVVPRLTSSLFEDVYTDTNWNLAVRVRPESYPYTNVAGVTPTNYVVELHGINVDAGVVLNEFTVTGALASPGAGREYAFVTGSRRVFAGAHRTNFTGALRTPSDVKLNSCRYWLNYLDDETLAAHGHDTANAGTSTPHFYAFPFNSSASFGEVVDFDTLVFNWEFSTNTSSNASGQFSVADESSGSNAVATATNGWLGSLLNQQYSAKGFHFTPSSTTAIDKDYVIAARQTLPENIYSTDMVTVFNQAEQEVYNVDSRPVNYYFAFEKSLYQNISEEILNYFATLKDLNTLIGAPVNRYRQEYKGLKFLREKFFATVANPTIDFDKFYEFYKWFDSALTVMLQQLVPASTDFASNVRTMIESHVLERSKYQSKFPFLEGKDGPIEGTTSGTGNDAAAMMSQQYNATAPFSSNTAYSRRQVGSSAPMATKQWSKIHAPPSGEQSENSYWWKEEANRAQNPTLKESDTATNNVRQEILTTIRGQRSLLANSPARFGVQGGVTVGGVGFHPNKHPTFVMDATAPAGRLVPGTNLPVNIMLSFQSDVEELIDTKDVYYPGSKQRLGFGINPDINRPAPGTSNKSSTKNRMDGNILTPFSLYSSSVKSGFNEEVISMYHSGVTITNLHHDIVNSNDVPMQGPFTEKYVGGWQYRHQPLNTYKASNPGTNYLDDRDTRAEGWMLKLGLCEAAVSYGSGALGIVGPQYPDASSPSGSAPKGYLFDRPKANLAREEYAKRPVNIRNIKMTTGSTIIGNYEHNYQVVQTTGRELNDPYFNDQSFNFAPYPETLATRGRFPMMIPTTGTATVNNSHPVIKTKITMTASVNMGHPFPGGVVLMGGQQSLFANANNQTLSITISCSNNTLNNKFVGSSATAEIIGWGGQLSSTPNSMARVMSFQSQSAPSKPTFVVHYERTTTDTTVTYANFITSSGFHNITVDLDDNGTSGATSVTTYLNGVVVSPTTTQLGLGSLKTGSFTGGSYAVKLFGGESLSSGANNRLTTFVSGAIASIGFSKGTGQSISDFYQTSGSTKDSYGRLTAENFTGPARPSVYKTQHFFTASVVTGTLTFEDVLNPGTYISPGGSFKSFVSSSMSAANQTKIGGGSKVYTWSGPPEGLGNTGGTLNYLLPSRTGSNSQHTVFVNRFAGSGYEVMSLGYMDPAHEAFSVYNALPYHNLSLRNYGLSGSASIDTSVFGKTITVRDQINKLRGLDQRATLHCGQFGHDAAYGSVPASTYVTTPSWHKTNRNPRKRIVSASGGYITGTVYDNLYVQHQIPRSTQQYSWITASLASGSTIFGLESPSCTTANSLTQLISGAVMPERAYYSASYQQNFQGWNGRMVATDIDISTHTHRANRELRPFGTSIYTTPPKSIQFPDNPAVYAPMEAGTYSARLFRTTATHDSVPLSSKGTTINIGSASAWDAVIGDSGVNTKAFTFSTWIYLVKPDYPWTNTVKTIFNFGDVGSGGAGFVGQRMAGIGSASLDAALTTNRLGFTVVGAGPVLHGVCTSREVGGPDFAFNEWHHIAITQKAGDPGGGAGSSITYLKIYVDGEEDTIILPSTAELNSPLAIAGADASLGEAGSFNDSSAMDSFMADVAIWDDELSAAEITTLYNNGRPIDLYTAAPSSTDLIAWWRFDQFASHGKRGDTTQLVYNRAPTPLATTDARITGTMDQHTVTPQAGIQFSRFSPNSVDGLNILNNTRNGAYGWPTWKQIRTGEHPVARQLRSLNKIGVLLPPPRVPTFTHAYSGSNIVASYFNGYVDGIRSQTFVDYTEQPLAGESRPVYFTFQDNTANSNPINNMVVKVSLGNTLDYFTNQGLNNRLNLGKEVDTGHAYNTVANFTVNSGLSTVVNYGQRVYPAAENAYRTDVRTRTKFGLSGIWNKERSLRSNPGLASSSFRPANPDGIIFHPSQSIWPLDGHNDYRTTSNILPTASSGYEAWINSASIYIQTPGELQSYYPRYYGSPWGHSSSAPGKYNSPDIGLQPGAMYNFPLVFGSASTSTGIKPVIAGDAEFRMGSKVPYQDNQTYEEFIRLKGKDYSIIPEFRISPLIPKYLNTFQGDFLAQIPEMFSLTGALIPNSSGSWNGGGFFKVYSNSDFLKYFRVVDNDIEEQRSGDLTITRDKMTLSCKGLLKLRPYKGFYPAERTNELAVLFKNTCGALMNERKSTLNMDQRTRIPMEMTYAPGIMFNTIKSGLAVSSWTLTNVSQSSGGSGMVALRTGSWAAVGTNQAGYVHMAPVPGRPGGGVLGGSAQYYLTQQCPVVGDISAAFADAVSGNAGYIINKVPFETLYRPANFFNATNIASLTGSTGRLGGNELSLLYDTAPSQSLAHGGGASSYIFPIGSIGAAPSLGAGLGQAGVGINNYQSTRQYDLAIDNFLCATSDFFVNDFTNFVSAREEDFSTVTSGSQYKLEVEVYRTSLSGSSNSIREPDTGSFEMYARADGFGQPIAGRAISDYHYGTLGHVTPPYFDGPAKATMTYTAQYTGQPTLDDIIANTTVVYDRIQPYWAQNRIAPKGGTMNLDSSYNFFEKITEVPEGTTEQKFRWLIQSKYETPVINMSNTSCSIPPASNMPKIKATGSSVSPATLNTLGLWHQRGEVPKKAENGVFATIVSQDSPNSGSSLAKVVGFPVGNPQRVGAVRSDFVFEEAVVAIPFRIVSNQRRFINLTTPHAKKTASYHKMVAAMNKYNFPPGLDFTKFASVTPVLMYVFEFQTVLSQQDVADIWQNVLPKIGESFATSDIVVEEQELLPLLSEGQEDLRWMVFKVKKRVAIDFERNRRSMVTPHTGALAVSINEKYSYNWPYDYCSLVELAQIEQNVQWVSRDLRGEEPVVIENFPDPRDAMVPGVPDAPQNQGPSAAPAPLDIESEVPNEVPHLIPPPSVPEATPGEVPVPPVFDPQMDVLPQKSGGKKRNVTLQLKGKQGKDIKK